MSIRLPRLNVIRTRMEGVNAFGGLNHNLRIKENEFYDMRNMSTALLPVMSSRKKRRKLRTLESPNGLFAHEKLCWADGADFYYDGEKKGDVADSPKQFVRMGAYVLIFPDKLYYNTHTDEFGALELEVSTTGQVTCELCRIDGVPYGDYQTGPEEPSEPANGDVWMDTSEATHVLRQYSEASGVWNAIPTVYTKISAAGIGNGFSKHDGVSISGIDDEKLTGTFYLVDAGEDYIIVVALIDQKKTLNSAVTIKRSVPDMDFVVEHDNRVWGCSSENHEIYASALGDPKNWNQYLGVASDSYAVTVGTAGDFTGAASHMGYIFFFKEDCVHQIMGVRPENYQLMTTNCRGVAKGSEKSLCRVNETLFYMSRDDVCAFNTALPTGISRPLGKEVYRDAVGGVIGGLYYLCLTNADGGRELYCYDVNVGVWIREDDADARWFAQLGRELYMLDGSGNLWAMRGSHEYEDRGAIDESDVNWMLETGDIGLDHQNAQFVSKIQLHAQCEAHSSIYVDVQYGASDVWQEVYSNTPSIRRSMVIPIIPRREKFIRLRLRGRGDVRLYSLTMRVEEGSDVYAPR